VSEPMVASAAEPPPEPPPAGDTVAIAYVYDGETVSYSWHRSHHEMIGWDLGNRQRIMRGNAEIAMLCGTDGLVAARNKAVAQFLETEADWLFWIDTDMGFPPYTVDLLMNAADPVERPVVGGLCYSQRQVSPDGLGGFRCAPAPTIFDWRHIGEQEGFAVRFSYSRDVVTRVHGTGSACILIHRSVFERVHEKYGATWYDRIFNKSMNELTSEDLSFCMRLGQLGIPVYVHTGVQTTHHKSTWIGELDYLGTLVPPPATAPTAVIVPVLRRPANAAPFMASLRATTGLAAVYAVADEDDQETIDAWEAAGATVLHAKPGPFGVGTFAEKVNLGYRETSEPWLFVVGDDVRFWPGWLDHAQAAADSETHVIGTDDMLNPRVVAGEHATHMLIRRSYVDEMGASWDGPGVVAHEGYRHWFVDDEIVIAAKARGVWSPCPLSKVEHLHPAAGKAAADEVYELGMSAAESDRALFEARAKVNL